MTLKVDFLVEDAKQKGYEEAYRDILEHIKTREKKQKDSFDWGMCSVANGILIRGKDRYPRSEVFGE